MMKKYFSLSALLLLGISSSAQESATIQSATVSAVSDSCSAKLSRILMFVSDKSSADIAAPKVADLLRDVEPRSIYVSDYDLSMMHTMRCFGSTALQKALAPVIPMLVPELYPEIISYKRYYEACWSYMDDMAATFERIDGKESADRAAQMVEKFPPFMLSLLEKMSSLTMSDDASARADAYIGRPVMRVKVGRLLTAWGQLKLRSGDYYGSLRLQASLDGLVEVLQNLDVTIDPDGVGVLTELAYDLLPLLHEWIDLARSVNDRVSADRAASRFFELRRRMETLAGEASVSSEYEQDVFNICPECELLVHISDHIAHYFERQITPAFYGSSSLKEALSHED